MGTRHHLEYEVQDGQQVLRKVLRNWYGQETTGQRPENQSGVFSVKKGVSCRR